MPETTNWRRWMLVALALAAALRVWAALFDHSIYWPDEIFQTLEPAHKLVFGHGFLPWEFRDGARSWALPGAYAGLFRVASWLGVDSALVLIAVCRLATVAMSLWALWLAMRVAEETAGGRAAFITGLLGATFPLWWILAHRCTSEAVAAPFLVLCVLSVERGRLVRAGVAAGVAFALRYQNGLVGACYVIQLLARRRFRDAGKLAAGGAAVVLASGLLDWITWGRPFHSLIVYVQFNLSPAAAAAFGSDPPGFYLRTLATSSGPAMVVVAVGFVAGTVTRARALGALVLIYIAAHSLIPHKELRFLVGIVPLLCVVAGIGLDAIARRLDARAVLAVAVVTCAALGVSAAYDRYPDLGHRWEPLDGPVWHTSEGVNLLVADAGRRPDICGLELVHEGGNYTYFHRDVTLGWGEGPAVWANYVVSTKARAGQVLVDSRYVVVRELEDYVLLRRDGGCVPANPPFRDILPGSPTMGLHPREWNP